MDFFPFKSYCIFIYNIFCDISVFYRVDEGAKGGVKIKSICVQDSVWRPGLMISVIYFWLLNVQWIWPFPFRYHILHVMQLTEFKKSLNTVNSACEEVLYISYRWMLFCLNFFDYMHFFLGNRSDILLNWRR